VFYVGKGTKNRWSYHQREVIAGRATNNPHKDRIIKQILDAGLEPSVRFPYTEIHDEDEAYRLEESLQLKYGIENLTNIAVGYRPPRVPMSQEQKERQKRTMAGNKLAAGRKQTVEERQRRGQSLKKAYDTGTRKITDAVREASSRTHRGKTLSEETKQKISAARKGKKLSAIISEEDYSRHLERCGAIPVVIDGITYRSLKEAERVTGIPYRKLKAMLYV
jgi:uncharacterized protein (DUF885 family)